jgi:hypothetical protein
VRLKPAGAAQARGRQPRHAWRAEGDALGA